MLLPLSLNEKILGIMSLGPKQSEEPFSKTDIRLLDSVAAQTGLALENGRLTAAVAAEVAARAKQTRDIEIARDVQQRLFPQEYPPIAWTRLRGRLPRRARRRRRLLRFHLALERPLGIAIGDVSGKGIPAALLMATLRAYLRGAQTIHHQADLTEADEELERAGLRKLGVNRYATFFYGELDTTSRALDLRERRSQSSNGVPPDRRRPGSAPARYRWSSDRPDGRLCLSTGLRDARSR